MATRTASYRYATRAAVNGSSAYDLRRLEEYERIRPAARSSAAERPRPKPENPEAAPKAALAQPRAARATARSAQGVSAFSVVGFAVVAVLMLFVVLAHVRLSEVADETARLQSRLSELSEEERKLRIAYEDAFDVNKVAQYATDVLGMTKPIDAQISTVQSTAQDKAVVVDSPRSQPRQSESVVTFLASLVAYFKQMS